MSKFFYKGRIEKKPKHESFGFSTNRTIKPGTEENPLTLTVNSDERKLEVIAIAEQHELVATVVVDDLLEENIQELNVLINKPKTATFEKTPSRNDPCNCGSGKKYKKCCG